MVPSFNFFLAESRYSPILHFQFHFRPRIIFTDPNRSFFVVILNDIWFVLSEYGWSPTYKSATEHTKQRFITKRPGIY